MSALTEKEEELMKEADEYWKISKEYEKNTNGNIQTIM